MITLIFSTARGIAVALALIAGSVSPRAAEIRKTLELTNAVPASSQVTAVLSKDAAAPGLAVIVKPGEDGYPGCTLKPTDTGVWNLAAFGHLDAVIANNSEQEARVFLRVDNKGDWKIKPWNTESARIEPGTTKTIRVIFGHSDGHKPGFKLDSAAIPQLLFFTDKTSKERRFRIVSLTAAGPPGETPPADRGSVRVKPGDGVLLGAGVPYAMETKGGAVAAGDGAALRVTFSGKDQSVIIRPELGMWDLREAHHVQVKIKNTGKNPIAPAARLNSAPGNTDLAIQPVKPGESGNIFLSFIPAVPWTGDVNGHLSKEKIVPGKGTAFISDAADSITINSAGRDHEQQFTIESITAGTLPAVLPDWIGKRPPVDGDWALTFSEEFDGNSVDLGKWNIYTANYWDKLSHFSKDNVIVRDGTAALRYEKKRGRHNDDPKGAETPYATGFLDTCGKWVQRYGYFESRMKLPRAPGLWPAMWLMPDRGLAAGEQWKRASTSDGGMEFDIMEHLTRWGPHRFNIAFHWDGYQDAHKQTGTTTIYTGHDRDGFITSGLLWLPGKAVIYCNGRETARWESPRVCSVPCGIMFTHVMGGWDNNDLDDARLPDEFIVDYVRCWQRKDLTSAVDGVKSTQPTPAAPVSRK